MVENWQDYAGVVAGVASSGWGLYLAVNTPDKKLRRLSIAGILILAVVGIVVGFSGVADQKDERRKANEERQNAKLAQDKLLEAQDRLLDAQASLLAGVTGGSNFPYLKALISDRVPLSGPVPIYMAVEGTGPVYDLQSWISPGSANRNADHPDYKNGYDLYRPTIYKSGVSLGAIPLGEWWVETETRNGHWAQFIKLYVENGHIKQEFKVLNENNQIIKEFRQ